ncbi:phosphoribosyltransferase [Mycobacterium sp. EPa45]|nr:phosphoribosyltransferase [Mycobacterium sp. EPa45]
MHRYADRADAGRRLAGWLLGYRDRDPLVLGLPRGGVPVAYEVAKVLGAPLDVLVVRKLGVPTQPELAFGAIGEGGVRVINESVLRHVPVSEAEIAEVETAQRAELQRRVERYRGDRPPQPLAGRVVIIVDDGFATGSTARAACLVARAQGAAKVVLAAPIGSPDTIVELGSHADEVVCPGAPQYFSAVGQGYDNFHQTSDEEVTTLLECAERGFTQ